MVSFFQLSYLPSKICRSLRMKRSHKHRRWCQMAASKIIKLNILAIVLLMSFVFILKYTQRGRDVKKAFVEVDYFPMIKKTMLGYLKNGADINEKFFMEMDYFPIIKKTMLEYFKKTNGLMNAVNTRTNMSNTSITKDAMLIVSKNASDKRAIQSDTQTNVNNDTQNLHPMYSCKNGSDCFKLNELLRTWNDSKPKAAICILTSNLDRYDLIAALRLLDKNFISLYDYPVIIFHEKLFFGFSKYRKIIKDRIFFQEIELKSVDFLNPVIPPRSTCPWSDRLAYRNMCRFQAKIIFELPIMQNLDYYMRLDSHSYIFKKVPLDIFAHMKSNQLSYGYPCVWRDDPRCMKNLRFATDFYIKTKNIKPHFYEKMSSPKMFMNNLQIGDLNFFRGPSYQNYIKYIDTLGGIYYHRWGDAPIISLAVSMFVPENQTRQLYDIHYKHRKEVLTKGETYTGPREWTCPPI